MPIYPEPHMCFIGARDLFLKPTLKPHQMALSLLVMVALMHNSHAFENLEPAYYAEIEANQFKVELTGLVSI